MSAYNGLNAWDTLYQISLSIASPATLIDEALAVPAPDGSPPAVSEAGIAYYTAGTTLNGVCNDLNDAYNQLPAAWNGDAAVSANQQVRWLADLTSQIAAALCGTGAALKDWAGQLHQAQRSDTLGRDQLTQARPAAQALDSLRDPGAAQHIVMETVRDGINSMLNGAYTVSQGAPAVIKQMQTDLSSHSAPPSAVLDPAN